LRRWTLQRWPPGAVHAGGWTRLTRYYYYYTTEHRPPLAQTIDRSSICMTSDAPDAEPGLDPMSMCLEAQLHANAN
jgi:hypothetical protein